MDRRTFVVSAVGLAVAGPGVRTARAARTPPLLQLRVERKVTSADCMRGYLLTRVSGEAKWTAACYVLELPDRDNVKDVSAVPTGVYPVHVRVDGTQGWRLELEGVKGHRENVQIHVGNYPSQTKGCLLVGAGTLPDTCVVSHSAEALAALRALFAVFGEEGVTTLEIA